MTRSESLALLHAWAGLCRGILPPVAHAYGPTLADAESHGARAVHAVRETSNPAVFNAGQARVHASRAVRSALAAVGIRGAL